jgi:uncharacterized protein YcbK (DUF882 family)
MSSRAFATYFGALVALASPVPLSGEPSPPPTSGGYSLRKGPLMASNATPGGFGVRSGVLSTVGARAKAATANAGDALGVAIAPLVGTLALADPASALLPKAPGEGSGPTPESPPGSTGAGVSDAGATPDAEGPAGPAETLATLVNVHSNEAVALDTRAPSDERFARLLPDRTNGDVHRFDPRLLGVVRRVAERHPGARIDLVSGYRSPKFNEHLRKKGHRVASHSEHSLGHALDFRVEGLSPVEIVAELRALGWKGGIGRYDGASDRFVHVDVGRERFWMGH